MDQIGSVGLAFLGFFLVSGYVPPPKAYDAAQEISSFYRENTDRLRIGLLLTFIAWAGWGTLTAALSTRMQRVGSRRPVLPNLQMSAGTATSAGSSRSSPSRRSACRHSRSPRPCSPTTARTPCSRWLGYFTAWCGVLFIPGGLLAFFRTGPFAYHGLFVFWVPFLAFGAYILVLAWMCRRAALRESVLEDQAGGAAAAPAGEAADRVRA